MPIRFRCGYCQKLLGIARRKAGTRTTCPHCGATITVPTPSDGATDADLAEIGALLDASPRPAPEQPAAPPATSGERPLFERDLDAVLGATTTAPVRRPAKPKPAPTPGADAGSLASTSDHVVLSSNKVTVLVVAVVMLLAVAFAAGFLIASR